MAIGWYGVDFDGTLAMHINDTRTCGNPVMPMVIRVRGWLAQGLEVRIMTARVGPDADPREIALQHEMIGAWCEQHLGRRLTITASKDYRMIQLWDDRAVGIIHNTGRRADGQP